MEIEPDFWCRLNGYHAPQRDLDHPVTYCRQCGVLLWEPDYYEQDPLYHAAESMVGPFAGPVHPSFAKKLNAALRRGRAWMRFGRQAEPDPPEEPPRRRGYFSLVDMLTPVDDPGSFWRTSAQS